MSSIIFTIQDINGDRLQLITTKLIFEGEKGEGSYPGKIVRERDNQRAKIFFGMVKGEVDFTNLYT